MADQFDVIESGERGRRRWIGLAVVVALLLIPVVGLLASREPEPEAASPTATPEPIRSLRRLDNPPNVLNAHSTGKGDDELIQVVFPNGLRAEVRYPAELGLDEMGSRPFQGFWIGDRYRQLSAPYSGAIEVTRGGRPLRNYADNVTLWPRQAGSGTYGQVLLFEFGRWRLAMYDRGMGLTFDERVALAQAVHGKVTKDGYLVLSADDGAVRLAKPGATERGEPVGPQLWFGGGAGEMVVLAPTPGCKRDAPLPDVISGRGRPAASVCRGDIQVAAVGSPSFRRAAIEGIKVTVK
ncbi:hypothetical protein [Nonomuraea jiangxiensis]|uniref:Uncharacterized protein n=1 Tax=Nonomuraea jiangxiensis TaxID=633440 RepID=A0A1G9KAM9_9ACTN|nr:hypothetical protein [Nonomuraea jiangxiensis]SDL46757.1 hypothetical protein SAMN05421869_12658 [Nonomuraea jiangxiensis]